MGILRLGIVTIYLSEPLVNGFTTGAAIHVFSSQFPKLFDVSVTRYSGPLALIYVSLGRHVKESATLYRYLES